MVNLTYIGSLIRIVCTAIKVAVFVVLKIHDILLVLLVVVASWGDLQRRSFCWLLLPWKKFIVISLTSFLHLLWSEAVFKSMPNKLPINIFAKQQPHHKHLEFLRKNVRLPAATAAWSAKTHSSGRNK